MLMYNTEFPKVTWDRHWSNGGTGITKNLGLIPEKYKKIAESVYFFGDAAIWMEDGINELHSYHKDLTVFWEFHRRLHGL